MAQQDPQLTDHYASEAAPLNAALTQVAHGDRQLAEDIAQESWLRAVLYWPTHGVPDRPGAWLRTVSRNLLFNERRRRRAVPLDQVPEEALPSESAEHAADSAEQLALLHAAIGDLPSDARQLIEQHYFAGESFAEIGQATGVSERAVEGRLRRIRIRLRAELEGRGVTSADLRGVAAATDLSLLSLAKAIMMSGVLSVVLVPYLMLLLSYFLARPLFARLSEQQRIKGSGPNGAAIPAQVTPAMLELGLRNALICMTGALLVVGIGAYGVASVTQRTLAQSAGIVGAVGYVVVVVVFFGLWLRGRERRGTVILDCGPHPTRWLFLMLAVLVPVMSLTAMLSSTSGRSIWAFGGPGLMLLQSPFMAVVGFSRLQVTELGLWQYYGLLPWEKIISASWTPESTLRVHVKGRFAALSKGVVPVPPAHRAAIAELLAQHGVATTA